MEVTNSLQAKKGAPLLPKDAKRSERLRNKIAKSGLSIFNIAAEMGVTDATLYCKIKGVRGWNPGEADLCESTTNKLIKEKINTLTEALNQ